MKLRANDITWREIDGDLVILDLRSSTYLTTNASGAVLMKELTDERTDDELVGALVGAYDISETQAESDVRSFVQALRDGGLLEEQPVH
ncbi:PqqD family protein [Tessaracoccus rhinocerotis]|uniref:PqqD family protein n=1 Tax=Tessaracoccus rhinocerotis TaxID=1689449 RepID=A0A553JX70_9ACTN|nr:PqqD family protein [Tessaracoccus rhinocerotis]TRY17023.1 PqqD family protein [Tessaracoccus rhinocerotis]